MIEFIQKKKEKKRKGFFDKICIFRCLRAIIRKWMGFFSVEVGNDEKGSFALKTHRKKTLELIEGYWN